MKKSKKIILTLDEESRRWFEELLRQLLGEKRLEGFRDRIKQKVVRDDRKKN